MASLLSMWIASRPATLACLLFFGRAERTRDSLLGHSSWRQRAHIWCRVWGKVVMNMDVTFLRTTTIKVKVVNTKSFTYIIVSAFPQLHFSTHSPMQSRTGIIITIIIIISEFLDPDSRNKWWCWGLQHWKCSRVFEHKGADAPLMKALHCEGMTRMMETRRTSTRRTQKSSSHKCHSKSKLMVAVSDSMDRRYSFGTTTSSFGISERWSFFHSEILDVVCRSATSCSTILHSLLVFVMCLKHSGFLTFTIIIIIINIQSNHDACVCLFLFILDRVW